MSAHLGPIVPVVMAGGSGKRLWPISRTERPKQFLSLAGEKSLFQQTLQRVSNAEKFAAPVVVTNAEYRFLVAEQAEEMKVALRAILLEPVSRNTAPAIYAAAQYLEQNQPDSRLIYALASDHNIVVDAAYDQAIDEASACAADGHLVTFGVQPSEPATGYGYIEKGDALNCSCYRITKFVEKPDLKEAKNMIASGRHLWNSGSFMFDRQVMLDEFKALAPDVVDPVNTAVAKAVIDLDFVRLDPKSFAQAPDISIDYAVFEKTARAAVVPAKIDWCDLGSWDAVWKSGNRDESDNVSVGNVLLSETKNSLVYTEAAQVTVCGLADIAVVASEDAIFVAPLHKAQQVRDLVTRLKNDERTAALTETHRTCYRPWGGYSSLSTGERFQVKRLFVKPGKQLSLQKHHHRSEHWVVVRGIAEVTIDDNVQMLSENQSVYIPQGVVHRLGNPGKILLELIEVQSGAYLGEDDIIRLEDRFGRI